MLSVGRAKAGAMSDQGIKQDRMLGANEASRSVAHLTRLTSLRAAGALLVFFYHLGTHGFAFGQVSAVTRQGYVGVSFFFVLSGFVLTWSVKEKTPLKQFYLKRFARIWPSHAVTLFIAACLPMVGGGVHLLSLLVSATLLQTWLPWRMDPFSFNKVAWSLSCETFFYLVLPLLLPILRSVGRRRRLGLLGGYSGLMAVMTLVVMEIPSLSVHSLVFYVWPPVRFGEFLLGVLLALEMRAGWSPKKYVQVAVVGASALLLFFGSHALPAPNVAASLLSLVVISAAAQRDLDLRKNGVLTNRALVLFGEISLAFYLVHNLVIEIFLRIMPVPKYQSVPVILVIAVLAAALLHYAVERPFERSIRARLVNNRTKAG